MFYFLLALCTALLNIVDGALTIYSVGMKLAIEANPLMARLLAISPVLFFLVKFCVVNAALIFLLQKREYLLAKIGLIFVFAAYVYIFKHHLDGLIG